MDQSNAESADFSADTADAQTMHEPDSLTDRLEADLAELKDLLLRRTADFDNLRRRTEREKMDWQQFAGMETVRVLLPALDDFDRALTMSAQTNPELAESEFYKGMALVRQRLVEALAKNGLEPIVAIGNAFDPNLHEAIDRAESSEVDDDTVLAEFQRGYTYRGKLLRPAMVKVSVKA